MSSDNKIEYTYAKKSLIDSGINFKEIPIKNILTTCKNYTGTISLNNYRATTDAIKDIYGAMNLNT